MNENTPISIIIPTFNGAGRIGNCLKALERETRGRNAEILVVDDGSRDNTAEVVQSFAGVRIFSQANAGPASARNNGARQAKGEILLFTDDDCVPTEGWLNAMLAPFDDPQVIGAKGTYRSAQPELAAKFVQIEYEDKYRIMAAQPSIDFIDTYSAAFRAANFHEMGGYDTSFPVACAEDIELSYLMSAKGWKMVFVPNAIVFHTHPNSFVNYFKKKYKFAFWRVLAVRKNPAKGVKDSHTPQLMKLQLLFLPALLAALAVDLFLHPALSLTALVVALFLFSTLGFALRAARSHLVLGILAPLLLAIRSGAQFLGVAMGMIFARAR